MDTTEIKNTALAFLTESDRVTAVIGSSQEDGDTHVATVYYYVDSNFNFYFLTATNTQKYRNLLNNPNAAIVVGFGPSYTTIQGQGAATLLAKGSDEEREAIMHLKRRLQVDGDKTWPLFQLDTYAGESIAVFKFTPQKLQFLNLEQSSGLVTTLEDILEIL